MDGTSAPRIVVSEATLKTEEDHYNFLKDCGPDQWPIKYLYDRLGILDNKAGALARFNAVVIGFLSTAVFQVISHSRSTGGDGTAVLATKHPDVLLWAILLILLTLGYAEYLSSRIFSLKFDRIKDAGDLERYKRNFFIITLKREKAFRLALRMTTIGNAIFLLLFLSIVIFQLKPSWLP